MSLMDLQRKIVERELEYYQNLEKYLKVIKRNAERVFEKAEVYLFGSVAEGRYIPGKSDIDVLVVVEKAPKTVSELVELKLKVLEGIDLFSPFEIHVVDSKGFEHYRRMCKKLVKV